MPLIIKNSATTTPQKPVVNINGEDFLTSDLTTLIRDATGVRTSAAFEDTLTPYVAPVAAAAKTTSNAASGLTTPNKNDMTTPVVVLNNGTAYPVQYGILSDEVGILVSMFSLDLAPQFVKSLGNKQDITVVDAYGPMEGDLTIEGEIYGTGGVNAAVLGTAFVTVNSITQNGAPTTGYYLQRANIPQSRSDFKKGTWNFKAKAGIP